MSRRPPSIPPNRPPCDLPPSDSTRSFWHKQPSPLLTGHRSTRNVPPSADVVIIGSGLTGASVAHHLLTPEDESAPDVDKNLKIVMLEAREACWGATGRNGGHCQPLLSEHPHDPSIASFELANFYALMNLISTRNIPCEFVAQKGVRAIYSQSYVDQTRSAIATLKINEPKIAALMTLVEDKAELARLRVPTARAALVTDVAARMWPYKFVVAILETLLTSQSLRGTLNLQTWTPATHISPPSDDNLEWTVKTDRGTIRSPQVILATNAYTSHLLPDYSDLIVPCRGQMSALKPPPSLADSHRLETSFGFMGEGLDDYLIQRPNDTGGHLMFGGGRQHDPSIGTVDDSILDADTAVYLRSQLINAFQLPEKSENNGRSDYPQLEAESEWTGIMGFSRDDMPWVGPVPESAGLYIAAGYTGHGMPNAWLCGKAVADMAMEGCVTGQIADPTDMCQKVCSDLGLPQAYVATKERIEKARSEMADVEVRDWAEMQRTAT